MDASPVKDDRNKGFSNARNLKRYPKLRLLALGWAVLNLFAGGCLAVTGRWQAWGFFLFWGLNLILGLLVLKSLQQARIVCARLKRQAGMARDLLWTADSDLTITAVHGAVEVMTGLPPKDLVLIPLVWLLPDEDAREFERQVRIRSGFTMETSIRQPSGHFRPVEITGAVISGPRPMSWLCRGRSGDRFEGVIRDLTDVRHQQRLLDGMEKKLTQSDKMKDLGILATGVAHDLNNILAGIATFPEVLLMDPSLGAKSREGIRMIQASGAKASSVVSDFLTIARGGGTDQQLLNVNTVIQRYMAATEFERMAASYPRVVIETDLEPELLDIRGSYLHIEKAVANLILNGVESVAGIPQGRVTLSTANFYADQNTADTMAPGEYAVLRVEDNGSEIPAPLRERIFDPFVTQKEMGKSDAGLGLTLVQNTVRDHRGEIRVSSDPGGTRFELFFPAVREEAADGGGTLEEIMGNGETLLVVDDLAEQRMVGASILKKLGYKVYTVADGLAAVAFVKERPVDLLVLDMVMSPSISGLETFRRIREIRPDQKAIIASGHPESEDVLKTQALGAGSFVKKPYTLMDMGIAVKEELAR